MSSPTPGDGRVCRISAPKQRCQLACKPGSVWPALLRTWRPFLWGRRHRRPRCDQPGRQRGSTLGCIPKDRPGRPYSVLLRVGLAMPLPLPAARCALTAPFHPYPARMQGGLLSVALSLGSPPPDVIRHPVSVEPGLSSISKPKPRDSGRPASWRAYVTLARRRVNNEKGGPQGPPVCLGREETGKPLDRQ
jgi:hypothetical protein